MHVCLFFVAPPPQSVPVSCHIILHVGCFCLYLLVLCFLFSYSLPVWVTVWVMYTSCWFFVYLSSDLLRIPMHKACKFHASHVSKLNASAVHGAAICFRTLLEYLLDSIGRLLFVHQVLKTNGKNNSEDFFQLQDKQVEQ